MEPVSVMGNTYIYFDYRFRKSRPWVGHSD